MLDKRLVASADRSRTARGLWRPLHMPPVRSKTVTRIHDGRPKLTSDLGRLHSSRHQVFPESPCAIVQTVLRLALLQAAIQETAIQARKIPSLFGVDTLHY